MKRHQIMDLFHAHQTMEVGDWYNVENFPEHISCKVKVKLADNTEHFAYFYADKCISLAPSIKPCFFWDCQTKEPLFTVTHWKKLDDRFNKVS